MAGAVIHSTFASSPSHRIYDGSRDQDLYRRKEASAENSITLKGWVDITQWRAENPNDPFVKVVAATGYFSSAIFGVIETAARLPASGIVNLDISRHIAYCISDLTENEEIIESYNKTNKQLKDSVCLCIEGVAQNFASTGTSLVSQQTNLRTATTIKNGFDF